MNFATVLWLAVTISFGVLMAKRSGDQLERENKMKVTHEIIVRLESTAMDALGAQAQTSSVKTWVENQLRAGAGQLPMEVMTFEVTVKAPRMGQ